MLQTTPSTMPGHVPTGLASRSNRLRRLKEKDTISGNANRPRMRAARREEDGTEPVCDACGSAVHWWTRLPLIVRLSTAWVRWVLRLMLLACTVAGLGGWLLVALLASLGVSLSNAVSNGIISVALTLGMAFGLALLLLREHNPKVCSQCGGVLWGWSWHR